MGRRQVQEPEAQPPVLDVVLGMRSLRRKWPVPPAQLPTLHKDLHGEPGSRGGGEPFPRAQVHFAVKRDSREKISICSKKRVKLTSNLKNVSFKSQKRENVPLKTK